MAQFDAELYLRLTGERAVLDPPADGGQPDDSPLDAAGHALVAVRAMTARVAQAVVDDYELALAYRQGEHRSVSPRRAQRAARRARPDATLAPLRAVPCQRLIEQPWGQLFLSYVVLGDETTVLHVTMRAAPAPPGQRRAGAPGGRLAGRSRMSARMPGAAGSGVVGPGLPRQLTLTDDRGTTSTASFSGGGGNDEWQGEFEASPALAPDTAWIEVLGERVGLPARRPQACEVWVEPQAAGTRPAPYLWVKLASVAGFGSSDAMETSIEALVAAGALAAGDPALARGAARLGALFRGGRARPRRPTRPLPEPWRSVLARRGRARGPECLVVAGATTPQFDGITVAVLAVRPTDGRFYADVETVPGLRHWRTGPPVWRTSRLLAWWAADDRGHHYLGQHGRWHFSEEHSRRADRVQARAGPRREGARHHAHHDDRTGRDPGAAGLGRRPMSTPWWRGVPPAVAQVSCDGREHQLRWADGELRVPGHPDLESEKILRALAGENYACLDVLEAWEVHADDLRVLILASRGPADPVADPARRAWARGLDRLDRPVGSGRGCSAAGRP